jgi:electron-transferring-flavoprotein dehydrogenase
MRLAFKSGFWLGGLKAGLSYITHGALFGGHIKVEPDSHALRYAGQPKPFTPDGKLTFRKLDAVFKSKNATRDNIPSHLLAAKEIDPAVGEFYAQLCPANVYEVVDGKLHINPPNCVDCKATDVLAPRWTPREGGSGPKYTRM